MARYKVEISNLNTSNIKVLTNEEMVELFRIMKEGNELEFTVEYKFDFGE